MKTIIVDNNTVNCTDVGDGRYACHIVEDNVYFSAKEDTIERKAKAMMKAKQEFMREFPDAKFA